jgi:hypothetical protein
MRFSFRLLDRAYLACHAAGDHRDRPQRSEELIKGHLGGFVGSVAATAFLHCPAPHFPKGVFCVLRNPQDKNRASGNRRPKNLGDNFFPKK